MRGGLLANWLWHCVTYATWAGIEGVQICIPYFGWRFRAGRLAGLVAVALAAMFEGLVVDVGNRFQSPADSGMKTDSPTN